ncbi:hypothetical protein BH11BAC4_BH11BAC4_04930 [soil metagenome]
MVVFTVYGLKCLLKWLKTALQKDINKYDYAASIK